MLLTLARRGFWLAVSVPTILIVGVTISETVFVDAAARSRPGRAAVDWSFAIVAGGAYALSWLCLIWALVKRDFRDSFSLLLSAGINLAQLLVYFVLYQLAGEL